MDVDETYVVPDDEKEPIRGPQDRIAWWQGSLWLLALFLDASREVWRVTRSREAQRPARFDYRAAMHNLPTPSSAS